MSAAVTIQQGSKIKITTTTTEVTVQISNAAGPAGPPGADGNNGQDGADGEVQTVKVLNAHYNSVGNVGTGETLLDEHVIQGELNNDGESWFGDFNGTFIGNTGAVANVKMILENNGVITEVFNNNFQTGQNGIWGWIAIFNFIRIDNTRLKSITSHTAINLVPTARYRNITGLNLTLPISIKITGISAAGSDKIFSEFSKVFWAATA